ncbi:phosphomannomutase/phosphoglucomutase [Thiohalophilus thiocyanatoxydans]|uniref:phosphomannomutase n=1 Tax=Thiohalophilus thiocyanatoxydans TaxID=381308 RepID=A0A4R8J1R3_9GAMM|nr:phosphomannomutase/phosphoglucomutase [Thiohalophilus thiocyanatoxydans]TDY04129.1 phosphomannomutase/phosphoglucomutase [Thiohalophilus thiocyanatoxydans]
MARRRERINKHPQQPHHSGGLTLTAVSLIAFFLFSAILIVAVFVGQMTPLLALQTQENAVLENEARHTAAGISQAVADYAQGLHSVAKDPRTRDLLRAGDRAAIAEREHQLQSMFDGALRVRLLKPKIYSPDKSSEPHLSFACLDLQRQAEESLARPPVEVHAPGNPQQHIDIVEPVLNAAGDTVLGHVQLALDAGLLEQWVQQAASEGYVELEQKISNQEPVLLGKAGDPAYQARAESTRVAIPHTDWELSTWMPQVVRVSAFNVNLLSIIAVSIILVGIVVLLLYQAMGRSIRHDLENFMLLEASLLRGNKRHTYPMKMKEFRQMAERLDELAGVPFAKGEQANDTGPRNTARDQRVTDNSRPNDDLDDGTDPAPLPGQQAGPPAEIFKAYDIRGIVGRTLNARYATLIGQALGSEASRRGLTKIAFARDGRKSGPELGAALVRGLQAAGMEVIDVGMVPTPVLYYAAHEMAGGSGVMLTGSHNPPDYNGFKMMLGGETLSGEAIQSLRQRIEKQDFVRDNGSYAAHKVTDDYIKRIIADIRITRPLKVVIDCGNGVAGVVAPALFRGLGVDLIDIYSEVDGDFPNHHPDPSQPDNLHDVIELVRSKNADLGIAFDGDGDRLGVVNSEGDIIWPDRLMMLYAADILSRNSGAQIIYDIKCSSNLTRVIYEKGGEPIMWKTGHSLIKAKMKQSGALLAGEMSGHIFFQERWYGFDDALYAAARLLEVLANDKRSPREVFADLPDSVNTPELRIDLAEGEQHRIMEELVSRVDFEDASMLMIDGIRADFEDGWGLVRASNTTPSLILRFEARDSKSLQRIQQKFRELLQSVRADLAIPF